MKQEEKIELIKPFMYCYMGSGMLTDEYDENVAVMMAKNTLEALEKANQLQNNWISVNKRVDIKGGKYLVYDPNWIEDNKIRTAFYRNYNGIWIADNGSDDVIHPSHYMKLPNDPTNE